MDLSMQGEQSHYTPGETITRLYPIRSIEGGGTVKGAGLNHSARAIQPREEAERTNQERIPPVSQGHRGDEEADKERASHPQQVEQGRMRRIKSKHCNLSTDDLVKSVSIRLSIQSQ
jgi:hypothetical protein